MQFVAKNPTAAFACGALAALVMPSTLQLVKQVGRVVYWKMMAGGQMKRIAARKAKDLKEQLNIAAAYANQLDSSIKAVIAESETIPELLELQKSGKASAEQILQYYWGNTVAAHEKTNCLVAMDTDAAIAAAKAADAALKDGGVFLGPLHGIPVSLKDCIGTKGMDSTIGCSGNCYDPLFSLEDAPLAAQVRAAGAVIVGKTNIPQTMLSFECYNGVFGACTNPYSNKHTCGGSSGGEAALLALKGAPVGIGSDIGGSIRIPSHFCGIYGLKPTQWRLSISGFRSPVQGQEGVPSVAGPMSARLENVEYMFKVLTSTGRPCDTDGNLLNIPFRDLQKEEGLNKKKLNVGWYVDDGILEASPACQRAVRIAVQALADAGHNVIPVGSVDNTEAMRIFYQFIAADGGQSVSNSIFPDPASPHVSAAALTAGLPHYLTVAVGKLIALVTRDKLFGNYVSLLSEVGVYDYYGVMYRRNIARNRLAGLFAKDQLDVIIAPGLATPAPALGSTTRFTFGCAMTACLNVCDMSVMHIPVTTVDPAKDQWTAEQLARKKQRGNTVMNQVLSSVYKPEEMAGLPVGVQVVAPRLSEEFVLGVAAKLDAALRKGRGGGK